LTLNRFLEDSGSRVRVYDVGRRVSRIDGGTWTAFEQATLPYPLPLQRKAWVAIVQIAPEHNDPVIWFLRLSLDEQGLLIQAERDYLLQRLLESAQARSKNLETGDFLSDNPYAFQPRPDRMALFHAMLSTDLKMPPSRFFDHATAYLRGETGWDQWSFVGYQGIADAACRLEDATIAQAIPHLPDEPLRALCHCLESRTIEPALRDALIHRLEDTLQGESGSSDIRAALIRGLAGSVDHAETRQAVFDILDCEQTGDIEELVAISGRAWRLLEDPALLRRFAQRLATSSHGHEAFRHCIDDLLSLPVLADKVRQALRSPDAPAEVRLAFDRMLQPPSNDDGER
jgi:hypothetical protein